MARNKTMEGGFWSVVVRTMDEMRIQNCGLTGMGNICVILSIFFAKLKDISDKITRSMGGNR